LVTIKILELIFYVCYQPFARIPKIVGVQALQNKDVLLLQIYHVFDGSVVRHQARVTEIAGS
jgi:hypothetical protein